MTKEQRVLRFITAANTKYDNKFSYANMHYINSKHKIEIECPIHGPFLQTPEKHLSSLYGCASCANTAVSTKNTTSRDVFIRNAKTLHGYKFDYSKVDYISYSSKVVLICNNCSTEFEQTPNSHMNGNGCPNCATSGFSDSKPATLYYLSINNGQAYKIGITNRTVELRFSLTDLRNIEVIATKHFTNGLLCRTMEREILKKYSEYKYVGKPLLKDGNTELFSIDVFNADYTAFT